jgi:hypothetical protein
MKPALMMLTGLLLSPSILTGQQAGSATSGTAGSEPLPSTQQGMVLITVPGGQPCPVILQAKQGFGSGLVKVRHAPDGQPEPAGKPGQHIHLIVTQFGDQTSASKLVGATVTARGLSARGRLDKASGSGSADLRRTLNVTFRADGDHSLTTELVLPGFTAVQSIKIESLEYADGSTRDLSGKKFCTVQPDPLMLVADR